MRRLKDPFSGLTHLLGALLSIIGLTLLIVKAVTYGDIRHIVSFSVFGASLILLYTASSLYHLLPLSRKGILALRRIDHIMIFVLIAGTYTPVCLIPLQGGWGYSLLAGVWFLAVLGIVLKIFWMETPRWLSTSIYLSMGWLIVIAFWPLIQTIPLGGVVWMVLGGAFYSAGAVFYGTKWPPNLIPGWFGFHEVFHLFVMAGSFSHFLLMLNYIMFV